MTKLQQFWVNKFFTREFNQNANTNMVGQWVDLLYKSFDSGRINYSEFRSLAGLDIIKQVNSRGIVT